MYTICHQMLTIASTSKVPPVLPHPAAEHTTFPILVAFTQSLAVAALDTSCLQLPHSDIRVSVLACNLRLPGYPENKAKRIEQSVKLSAPGLTRLGLPINLL